MPTSNELRQAISDALVPKAFGSQSALDALILRAHSCGNRPELERIRYAYWIGYIANRLAKADKRTPTYADYAAAERSLDKPLRERSELEFAAYKAANVAISRLFGQLGVPALKVGSYGAVGLKRAAAKTKEAANILAIGDATRRLNETLSFVERRLEQCQWLLSELIQAERGGRRRRIPDLAAAVASAQEFIE